MQYNEARYDIYPKVVSVGKPHRITVRAREEINRFWPGAACKITVCPMEDGNPAIYKTAHYTEYQVAADDAGCLNFTHTFDREEEYFIKAELTGTETRVKLGVYAVEPDLAERLPFKGNLHTHTTGSDGQEEGFVNAVNFRSMGYDFIGITDHYRYKPALDTLEFFRNADMDFTVVPGEEVHLPDNDVHIVNFGGKFSVNALLLDYVPSSEVGNEDSVRALPGVKPPAIISIDGYFEMIRKLADTLTLPEEVDAFTYASCLWAYQMIAEAEGLSVFCHPCLPYYPVFHVPMPFTRYMLAQRPFDAFEVLGGEFDFEQNGYQMILYYENLFSGNAFPIVGNSDCHCSCDPKKANVAFSFVFAKSNTAEDLIAAIKEGYSVAVDGISSELRFVGPLRLVKYARFLQEMYFPEHASLCDTDSYLMKLYADGDPNAAQRLLAQKRKIAAFRERNIAP